MQQNTLALHLKRLRRENRRWRLTALLLVLGYAILLFAAFDYPQPTLIKARTVEAQSFVLRDVEGHIWARMGINADGPQLTFFNEHGAVISSLPLKAEVRPAR